MKRLFLILMRYNLALDRYCGEVSGNKLWVADCIKRIADIDRELDLLEVQRG
jgi:hypothetical protein